MTERNPPAAPAQPPRRAWIRAIAALWGFAEATLFFVVPDVWISHAALRSLRQGLWAGAFALAGALVGGIVVYGLGLRHEDALLALYERLPAISGGMIEQVGAQLRALGGAGMVLGGFSGSPYKLYAAQAASAGMDLAPFLAASALARGLRFGLVALVAAAIGRWLAARFGPRATRRALVAFWVLFYAGYWSWMPG